MKAFCSVTYQTSREMRVYDFLQYADNSGDLDALIDLQDIQDELLILQKLMGEQCQCMEQMQSQYQTINDKHGKGKYGTTLIKEALRKISMYNEQFRMMYERARATQQAVRRIAPFRTPKWNWSLTDNSAVREAH